MVNNQNKRFSQSCPKKPQKRIPKKLIVFDWNGTLLADTVASWKAGNICLEFYGAAPISLQRYRETASFPVIHFYHQNGVDTDTVLKHKEEANRLFQAAYENLAARARTRAGARGVLDWITAQGLGCIILSNYQTERIAAQLGRLKIAQYFDYVSALDCGGTTILQSITKHERLQAYMDKHGYAAENTYIVGDSMEEPDIGRKLGLTSIGITDGYISHARMKKAAPDYIIHRLDEIKPLVSG